MTLLDPGAISAFVQVVMIDVTLAGDNAIVVGIAAGGLPPHERRRAITLGIAIATVLRIALALVASQFLAVIGMTLAGGLLLLWVAWKMFREIVGDRAAAAHGTVPAPPRKTIRQALFQIAIADVSMSIDNVLAVAGTARDHPLVLVTGLILSIALMGAASTMVSKMLNRMPWLVWLGLGIIAYVALDMIYHGWREVGAHLG